MQRRCKTIAPGFDADQVVLARVLAAALQLVSHTSFSAAKNLSRERVIGSFCCRNVAGDVHGVELV